MTLGRMGSRLAAWTRVEPGADAWTSYGALAIGALASTLVLLARSF